MNAELAAGANRLLLRFFILPSAFAFCPTVATVPPSFTVRLAAMGNGLNAPTAFNKARSFAASTFNTDASIKPVPVSKRTFAASLTT